MSVSRPRRPSIDCAIRRDVARRSMTAIGCLDITAHGNPHFTGLRMDVQARDLSQVTVATNVGPGGEVAAYPGTSDRKEDHRLWQILPLFAIRNEGSGSIVMELHGQDDPTEVNEVYQEAQCSVKTDVLKTDSISSTINVDRPLQVRFYSWIVRQGSCAGSSQSGPSPVKCNGSGDELRDDFGQNAHCGGPGGEETIPFHPRFIASSSTRSALTSRAETTMYFVPNLFDRFMASEDGGRWYGHDPFRFCQSDWFFSSLLREYEPDLLHATLNS